MRAITPYTAPEVVLGSAADARSDIFGFGAILFEMLTGRRAFDGEARDTLAATGNPALDRPVCPCLTQNPDARIASMPRVMMVLKLVERGGPPRRNGLWRRLAGSIRATRRARQSSPGWTAASKRWTCA